jgi:hypothetical protein
MHADRRFPSDWNPVLVLGSGSALLGGFGLLFFQCPTLPQVYENAYWQRNCSFCGFPRQVMG